ncbi:MAG: ATP-binding protein [Ahniella sp.]|nr:ATP-binding protein [Ahniella sp.]
MLTVSLPEILIVALALALISAGFWIWRREATHKARQADLEQQLSWQRQETERIARATQDALLTDLHDDLGASLLTLIYAAPTPEFADRLRAVLQDLRDIVTRARATPGNLEDTLSQIEAEARERLGLAGLDLDWQQSLVNDPRPLGKPLLFHLFRLFREAISNTLKHAEASSMHVRLNATGETLHIEIRDNGRAGSGQNPGQGKSNMRSRTDHLHGSVTWRAATQGGTKVLLAIPLHGELPT